MKVVLFDGAGSVRVGDVPKPEIMAPKDAIIRITQSSICGSDLNILSGKIVLEENGMIGHEGVGVVEEVGPEVRRVKPGDRVVISYSVQCGECVSCKRGYVVFCKNGGQLGHGKAWGDFGGTQAEYLRVPWADANLEPIPDGVREEQVMFISDILSTGYQACQYGSIQHGDVVAVFGAGPVGLCAVAASKLFGPRTVISVDMLDYRLEAAKTLGADIVINAGEMNAAEEIKRITGGEGVDVAIEAVGNPATFEGCYQVVRPAGRISIVGVFPFEKVGISLRDMLRRNLQIRAGRANMVNMALLMSLVQHGKLDVTSLVTHRMKLIDAVEAYRLFGSRTGNALKILLSS